MMAKVTTNDNFTIGEILKSKGIVLTSNNNNITIKHIQEKTPSKKTGCLALLKQHFNKLKQYNKEQITKAVNSGCDPDYVLKSSKEMGDAEPVFNWNNNGMLAFTNKKNNKKTA